MPYKLQPGDIQQKWLEYKKACDEHVVYQRYQKEVILVPKPKIYCLASFCVFAGIAQDELPKYAKNKNYKLIIQQVEQGVLARKLEALVNGEGSAAGLIFDLTVNYGLGPAIKGAKAAKGKANFTVTLNGQEGAKKAATGEAGPVVAPELVGVESPGNAKQCPACGAQVAENPPGSAESPPFSSQQGGEVGGYPPNNPTQQAPPEPPKKVYAHYAVY